MVYFALLYSCFAGYRGIPDRVALFWSGILDEVFYYRNFLVSRDTCGIHGIFGYVCFITEVIAPLRSCNCSSSAIGKPSHTASLVLAATPSQKASPLLGLASPALVFIKASPVRSFALSFFFFLRAGATRQHGACAELTD